MTEPVAISTAGRDWRRSRQGRVALQRPSVRLAGRPSLSCYERVPGCTARSGGKSASRSAASTW